METRVREHRHTARDRRHQPVPTEENGSPGSERGYRILLVDDNPDDRALITLELRREFRDLVITEISDHRALNHMLARGGFDLLITDYQLFWSDGLRVVEELKKRFPEVPVIMFTGTGSEEVAVNAMKAGVQDYVLKSPRHYNRLRAAVRGALESRNDRAEAARAEAKYKTLFDTVPVGLFRCTPSGRILDANPALANLACARNREDLLRRNFAELHPEPGDFQAWRDRLEREGSVAFVETRFRRANGDQRWVEIHAKALRDAKTGEVIYEGSVEDISERKDAEVEREKLIGELQEALSKVKTLAGLLPICSSCKKIRDERGNWNVLETFIENHSQAHFTHSFCPECAHRLYPEVFLDTPKI